MAAAEALLLPVAAALAGAVRLAWRSRCSSSSNNKSSETQVQAVRRQRWRRRSSVVAGSLPDLDVLIAGPLLPLNLVLAVLLVLDAPAPAATAAAGAGRGSRPGDGPTRWVSVGEADGGLVM